MAQAKYPEKSDKVRSETDLLIEKLKLLTDRDVVDRLDTTRIHDLQQLLLLIANHTASVAHARQRQSFSARRAKSEQKSK